MHPERPIIQLERSPVERVADVLTVLGIVVCVAGVAATFAWVGGRPDPEAHECRIPFVLTGSIPEKSPASRGA